MLAKGEQPLAEEEVATQKAKKPRSLHAGQIILLAICILLLLIGIILWFMKWPPGKKLNAANEKKRKAELAALIEKHMKKLTEQFKDKDISGDDIDNAISYALTRVTNFDNDDFKEGGKTYEVIGLLQNAISNAFNTNSHNNNRERSERLKDNILKLTETNYLIFTPDNLKVALDFVIIQAIPIHSQSTLYFAGREMSMEEIHHSAVTSPTIPMRLNLESKSTKEDEKLEPDIPKYPFLEQVQKNEIGKTTPLLSLLFRDKKEDAKKKKIDTPRHPLLARMKDDEKLEPDIPKYPFLEQVQKNEIGKTTPLPSLLFRDKKEDAKKKKIDTPRHPLLAQMKFDANAATTSPQNRLELKAKLAKL